MSAIIVKRPVERLKAFERAKTPPKPKTRGKALPAKPKKPPERRSHEYLFHRVKIEDETPRMSRKKYFAWWNYENDKLSPFQETLQKAAYEQYEKIGTRFLKQHENGFGFGADNPPGYEPSKAKKSPRKSKGRFRLKIKKWQGSNDAERVENVSCTIRNGARPKGTRSKHPS